MPPTERHRHLGAYLWLLVILVALGALGYLLRGYLPRATPMPVAPQQTQAQGFPPSAPAPTAADLVVTQKGFQYLVQYTDTGFHPVTLTVKKGETVRFTNTSSKSLTLTITDKASPTLTPGQYLEYTFSRAGTTKISSGSGESATVTIK